MHLSTFEILQCRCGRSAGIAALYWTLLCLSCLQAAAFPASSISTHCTRHLMSLHVREFLPKLQLFHAARNENGHLPTSRHRCFRHPVTMSTKDDDAGADQLRATGTVSLNTTLASPGTSESSSRSGVPSSLSRTLLVAIPLMMKFALVLIIKFLTDLVVFPLLLTYRAARLSKRRIVKIWKQWTSWSSKTRESSSTNDIEIDGYRPNGSAS
jgi:hypothetical protein